jgi:head-tail adaptor
VISAGLLRHPLAIERATAGAVDDYNQPSVSWSVLASVRGLVQPKSAREIVQQNDAGAVASTHTIYLPRTDVTAADRIRFDPDDGRLFELDAVNDAAGQGHHLEVDARLVTV